MSDHQYSQEKERCSGSYCQAVVFLVIKHDSISFCLYLLPSEAILFHSVSFGFGFLPFVFVFLILILFPFDHVGIAILPFPALLDVSSMFWLSRENFFFNYFLSFFCFFSLKFSLLTSHLMFTSLWSSPLLATALYLLIS